MSAGLQSPQGLAPEGTGGCRQSLLAFALAGATVLASDPGFAAEGRKQEKGSLSKTIPPAFRWTGQITLTEGGELTLWLKGPDAARARMEVRLDSPPDHQKEPEDLVLDARETSVLRIPNAQAGVWHFSVVPEHSRAAYQWMRSLAEDYEKDPKFHERPFSDHAQRSLTLRWRVREAVAYQPNRGLKVLRGGGTNVKPKSR